MKSVLKPTLIKIILTFVLFMTSSWLWGMLVRRVISDTFPVGFPLQFFLAWGPCQAGENCSEFNSLWLLLDVCFWYFISAFLVSRFKKN